jgi:hypothetical protein
MANEKIPSGESSSHDGNLNTFDLSRLRLSQDFTASTGVKKLLTTVPVRRPDRQSFIRVHPEWRLQTNVLELKEERETYLVDPSLWSELSSEVTPKVLLVAITREGVIFIWPIRLPGPDGRQDPWSCSALMAAGEAEKKWVRVTANMWLGAYELFTADANLPDPSWPDIGFEMLLKLAFKDRVIQDLDHPVVRKRGGKV